MSAGHGPRCHDVALGSGWTLSESAEVALEDYTRVIARAATAQAVHERDHITRVHVCDAEREPTDDALADVRAFARELASGGAGGLGWQ